MHHGVHPPTEEDTLGVVLIVPGSAACRFRWPWALPNVELVIFVLAQRYLPSLHWHLCSPHAGVITPDAMASVHCDAAVDTLSSQSWHLPRHYAGVLAWIGLAPCHCCAGVIALVMQASPPALAGVSTSIVLTSSPCTRQRRCLPRAGDLALLVLATSKNYDLFGKTIVLLLSIK